MNNPENKSTNERAASVSRQGKSLTVPASPLNDVKLDLAILLVMGALLMLVLWKIQPGQLTQGIILLIYGLSSMVWLVLKTRKILKKWEKSDQNHTEKSQGE